MRFLVDTNIISEVQKQNRANENVRKWFEKVTDDELFLSVLVVGEIRQGIERLRARDVRKAAALERWLDQVSQAFGSRILPVTAAVAQEWGRLNSIRTLPAVDSLLAATAIVHDLTMVTRNLADIADTGVRCLNPFES